MGFRFKLQRVLDLKLKQEDEKKNQIATLMQAIKTKEDELEALISEKKQKNSAWTIIEKEVFQFLK